MKKKLLFLLIPLLMAGLSGCVKYNGQGKPGGKSSTPASSEVPNGDISSVTPPNPTPHEIEDDSKEGEKITLAIVKITDGTKYVTDNKGAVVTGQIVKVNGKKFYCTKSSGKVLTAKVFKLNGKKYVANKGGKLVTGKWITVGDKKYYCNKSGVVTKVKKK